MTESRPLTKTEFTDLLNNSPDDVEFLKTLIDGDVFEFFNTHDQEGFLIDNVPVYCGCITEGNFTYTLMRSGVAERYPFTLYKMAKSATHRYADKLGDVKCKITSDSDEAKRVLRWALKMGYEYSGNGVYVMKGR